MDEKTLLIVVVAAFIGFIAFFITRSGENHGMLKPSEDATAAFESASPEHGLDYWFSGPESHPIALIGVEKRLRFDSAKHWVKIGAGEESLRRLIEGMQSKALETNRELRGFEMVDHRGERVGEWYSVSGLHAVIKRTGIDSVEIYPPSPEPVKP